MISSTLTTTRKGFGEKLSNFIDSLRDFERRYLESIGDQYSSEFYFSIKKSMECIDSIIANKLLEGGINPVATLKECINEKFIETVKLICDTELSEILLQFKAKVDKLAIPFAIYKSKTDQIAIKFSDFWTCQEFQGFLTYPLRNYRENTTTLFGSGLVEASGAFVGIFLNVCQSSEVNFLCGLTKFNVASFRKDNPCHLTIHHPLPQGSCLLVDSAGFANRKLFIEALRNKDIDKVTLLMLDHPEFTESSGFKEIAIPKNSEDPIHIEMRARLECFHQASSKLENYVAKKTLIFSKTDKRKRDETTTTTNLAAENDDNHLFKKPKTK